MKKLIAYDHKADSTQPNLDILAVRRKTSPLHLTLLCCALFVPLNPVQADPNFTDNGDGTLTDKRTNLMWMRCVAGTQTWNGTTCVGDASKYGYISGDALKFTSN